MQTGKSPLPSDPIAARILELRRQHREASRDAHEPVNVGSLVEGWWKKNRKRLAWNAAVVEAWKTSAPLSLQERCDLAGLDRGTLRIEVPDDGVKFELDRELRSGLQDRLVQGCKAPLSRVRVFVKALATQGGRREDP